MAAVRQIKWNSELLVTPMHEQGTRDVVETTLGRPHVVITKEEPPLQLPADPKRLFYVIGGTIVIFCMMWYTIHRLKHQYGHIKDPFSFFVMLYHSMLGCIGVAVRVLNEHIKRLSGQDDVPFYGMDDYSYDEEDLGLLADRIAHGDMEGDQMSPRVHRPNGSGPNGGVDFNISRGKEVELRPSSTIAQSRRKAEVGGQL